jgi:hypothetical protein
MPRAFSGDATLAKLNPSGFIAGYSLWKQLINPTIGMLTDQKSSSAFKAKAQPTAIPSQLIPNTLAGEVAATSQENWPPPGRI